MEWNYTTTPSLTHRAAAAIKTRSFSPRDTQCHYSHVFVTRTERETHRIVQVHAGLAPRRVVSREPSRAVTPERNTNITLRENTNYLFCPRTILKDRMLRAWRWKLPPALRKRTSDHSVCGVLLLVLSVINYRWSGRVQIPGSSQKKHKPFW